MWLYVTITCQLRWQAALKRPTDGRPGGRPSAPTPEAQAHRAHPVSPNSQAGGAGLRGASHQPGLNVAYGMSAERREPHPAMSNGVKPTQEYREA